MTATLTTLVTFPFATSGAGNSLADLITDSQGDLIGASPLGPYNDGDTSGLVFEIAKTSGGYANTPTTVSSFDGANPQGFLIDAKGDLFGTTQTGGANGAGAVFEIAKTPTGYASPTTLASFSLADNQATPAALIADA